MKPEKESALSGFENAGEYMSKIPFELKNKLFNFMNELKEGTPFNVENFKSLIHDTVSSVGVENSGTYIDYLTNMVKNILDGGKLSVEKLQKNMNNLSKLKFGSDENEIQSNEVQKISSRRSLGKKGEGNITGLIQCK